MKVIVFTVSAILAIPLGVWIASQVNNDIEGPRRALEQQVERELKAAHDADMKQMQADKARDDAKFETIRSYIKQQRE